MKAAIYVRVSTMEQNEHGYSIDEQKERLLAYCKAMSWDIVGVYVDGGFSGADINRPGLQKIVAEIKNMDVLVFYKLDRLSRSQKDTLGLIEDVFLKNKVDIVSLQEHLDTTTPTGRMMIGILASFAQLERETFKERSMMGRIGRAKSGKWIGTNRPPIGYDWDIVNQELIINIYEAEQVRRVFNMYMSGIGLRRIAELMHKEGFRHKYGDWSFWGGILPLLTNSTYSGMVNFSGQEFQGNHVPIIEPTIFNKVKEMLEVRKTGQTFKRKSALSHLLYCGNCGARMFYMHKKDKDGKYEKTNPKYVCYSRAGKPLAYVKDPNCKAKIWNSREIDEYIWESIKNLSSKKYIRDIAKDKIDCNSNKELEKRLKNTEIQINRLLELYQFGNIPADALNERIHGLNEEKNSIQNLLKATETNTIKIGEIQDIAKFLIDNKNKLEIPQLINEVSKLINKIIVSESSLEIFWAIGIGADE